MNLFAVFLMFLPVNGEDAGMQKKVFIKRGCPCFSAGIYRDEQVAIRSKANLTHAEK